MIAPLRRRHRIYSSTLLLLVPLLAGVALWKRPDVAVQEDLPTVLSDRADAQDAPLLDRNDLFSGFDIRVRQWRFGSLAVIRIEPTQPLGRPDVLAYWSPGSGSEEGSGGLPKDAFLLGPLAEGHAPTYPLPRAALAEAGQLILFSLAHGEMLTKASLPQSAVQDSSSPESSPEISAGEEGGPA